MMIFSLVAMIGLEKCCITSACLQWLCHSGERTVAHGPLVNFVLAPDLRQWSCPNSKMEESTSETEGERVKVTSQ